MAALADDVFWCNLVLRIRDLKSELYYEPTPLWCLGRFGVEDFTGGVFGCGVLWSNTVKGDVYTPNPPPPRLYLFGGLWIHMKK